MTHKPVLSVAQLKKLCIGESKEFFIMLNGGIRSYKEILYGLESSRFKIINNIDNTIQYLTDEELYTKSNIGEAINKQSFYQS